MNTQQKKGMSLAEICVVLAVISIVSLMVVSFTTMVSTRSAVSAAKLKAMEDIDLTEAVLDGWIGRMASENAVTVAENGKLYAVKDSAIYTVKLENSTLSAPLADGSALSCQLNTVTALSVQAKHDGSGDAIYFCTVEFAYPDPRGGTITQNYTFCINPRVGETVDS